MTSWLVWKTKLVWDMLAAFDGVCTETAVDWNTRTPKQDPFGLGHRIGKSLNYNARYGKSGWI